MTLFELKSLYSRFLSGHGDVLHFSAHSHHFWPDVSREAQLQYWDDCALLSDQKWEKIFSEVIPKAQQHVARMLALTDPKQVVFAPNTHELTSRLLSLFVGSPGLRILTTSSEFHSWSRQIKRLKELPAVAVDTVDTSGFLTGRQQVLAQLKDRLATKYDLFFISQVFYDSGLALTDQELLDLKTAAHPETLMVVDGYHGFAALPSDLSLLEGKVFYLGGGYKYAQAGEGTGFMVVPKGNWRPVYTGWYAEHNSLSNPSSFEVSYAPDAMAFMGATQDPSGLYRFNAVWDQFRKLNLGVPQIHQTIRRNQLEFLGNLPESFTRSWKLTPLFDRDLSWHGHFLTFEAPTPEAAQACLEKLREARVLVDRRGARLRFGFGLYQNQSDVRLLNDRLKNVAKSSQ